MEWWYPGHRCFWTLLREDMLVDGRSSSPLTARTQGKYVKRAPNPGDHYNYHEGQEPEFHWTTVATQRRLSPLSQCPKCWLRLPALIKAFNRAASSSAWLRVPLSGRRYGHGDSPTRATAQRSRNGWSATGTARYVIIWVEVATTRPLSMAIELSRFA